MQRVEKASTYLFYFLHKGKCMGSLGFEYPLFGGILYHAVELFSPAWLYTYTLNLRDYGLMSVESGYLPTYLVYEIPLLSGVQLYPPRLQFNAASTLLVQFSGRSSSFRIPNA